MAAPKAKTRGVPAKRKVTSRSLPVSIQPVRDGGWLPVEEFYAQIIELSTKNVDIVVDLGGVEYLDASSLQMLLALNVAQKAGSCGLAIQHASPGLLCWFEYAGAVQEFTFA